MGEKDCCEGFAERQTQCWQGAWKSDTGPQIGLRSNKVRWRGLSKAPEGRIFLVFVTKSDGMLWWHKSEKRAQQLWDRSTEHWWEIGHADSQQIACLETTGGCSASLASLLPGDEEKNLFKCLLFSHFTTYLCYYNADLVCCYPESSRWCYW